MATTSRRAFGNLTPEEGVQHRSDDFHQALQDSVSSSSSTSSKSMTTTTPSKSTCRVCTKSKSKSSSESTSTPHTKTKTKTKTLYDQSSPYEAVGRATRPIFFFVAFRGVVGLGIRRMADLLRAFLLLIASIGRRFRSGSLFSFAFFLCACQMFWCRSVPRQGLIQKTKPQKLQTTPFTSD
jgi:hypothetical protein